MNQEEYLRKGINTRIGWDIVLFFSLYIIAPAYLAAEIHRSLPLITLSRGLLVLVGLMTLIRRRDLFRLSGPDWKGIRFGLTENRLLRWGLLAYFGLLLISDIALFPADKAESLKAIFVVLLEEYALVWLLSLAIDTREKLKKALACLSVATGVAGVLATASVIMNFNPFHLLNTVEREMLMTSYYRLGALRAETGFGHPVFYGAFCVVMTPIMMFFVESSDKLWKRIFYGVCLSFNLAGLFLSNSRGSLLVIIGMFLLIIFIRVIRREIKSFVLIYLPVLLGVAVIVTVALATMPHGDYFFAMTMQSLVKEFFPSSTGLPNLPTDPTEPIPEYGENAGGTRSRLVQLTGVWSTLQNKPLFGYGSNAHTRGLIYYQFVEGSWWPGSSFDMGLVSVVCQYGIVGLLGYGAMYASVFLTTVKKKYRNDSLMQALSLAFVAYMGCMFVISSLPKMLWVLIASVVCLVNIMDQENASR